MIKLGFLLYSRTHLYISCTDSVCVYHDHYTFWKVACDILTRVSTRLYKMFHKDHFGSLSVCRLFWRFSNIWGLFFVIVPTNYSSTVRGKFILLGLSFQVIYLIQTFVGAKIIAFRKIDVTTWIFSNYK